MAAQKGRTVEAIEYPFAGPAAFGGQIRPGTYELTQLDEYVGGATPDGGEGGGERLTGRGGRATVYVSATQMRFVESYGADKNALPPDSVRGVSYAVPAGGTNLLITPQCPNKGAEAKIAFTGSGGVTFILYDGPNKRATYRRLP
jgi:hypothetical protein